MGLFFAAPCLQASFKVCLGGCMSPASLVGSIWSSNLSSEKLGKTKTSACAVAHIMGNPPQLTVCSFTIIFSEYPTSKEQKMTTQTHLKPDAGISGHLFHTCIELCCISCSFAAKAVTSQSQQRQLSRILQSLSLWGDSYGELDGSLDAVLQKSPASNALSSSHCDQFWSKQCMVKVIHSWENLANTFGRSFKASSCTDDFQATSKSKNVAQLFEQSSLSRMTAMKNIVMSNLMKTNLALDPSTCRLPISGIAWETWST